MVELMCVIWKQYLKNLILCEKSIDIYVTTTQLIQVKYATYVCIVAAEWPHASDLIHYISLIVVKSIDIYVTTTRLIQVKYATYMYVCIVAAEWPHAVTYV